MFEPYVFNGCHDVSLMFINRSNVAILSIRGVDYCFIIDGISKSEAVHLQQNAKLKWIITKYKFYE